MHRIDRHQSCEQCFATDELVLRKYDYPRKLPHLQKDYKALFITFGTKNRWILPEEYPWVWCEQGFVG